MKITKIQLENLVKEAVNRMLEDGSQIGLTAGGTGGQSSATGGGPLLAQADPTVDNTKYISSIVLQTMSHAVDHLSGRPFDQKLADHLSNMIIKSLKRELG